MNFLNVLFGQSSDPLQDQWRDSLLSSLASAISSGGDFGSNIAGAVGQLGQVRAGINEERRRRQLEQQALDRQSRLDAMNAESHRAEMASRALADEAAGLDIRAGRSRLKDGREERAKRQSDLAALSGVREGAVKSLTSILGPDDPMVEEARQVLAASDSLDDARVTTSQYVSRARERAALKKRGMNPDDPVALISAEAEARAKAEAKYRPSPGSQPGIYEYGGNIIRYNPLTGQSSYILKKDVSGENSESAKGAALRMATSGLVDPGGIYDMTRSIIEQLERVDAERSAQTSPFGGVVGGSSSTATQTVDSVIAILPPSLAAQVDEAARARIQLMLNSGMRPEQIIARMVQ